MSDTKEELQRGEDFQTEWESNKDAARDEMIDQATNILLEVEHFVDEIDLTVDIRHVLSAPVYGKYNHWVEDFDYDFTEETRDILKDQLGFKLILIGDK